MYTMSLYGDVFSICVINIHHVKASVMCSLHFIGKPQPPPATASPPQAGAALPEAKGMIARCLCLQLCLIRKISK